MGQWDGLPHAAGVPPCGNETSAWEPSTSQGTFIEPEWQGRPDALGALSDSQIFSL